MPKGKGGAKGGKTKRRGKVMNLQKLKLRGVSVGGEGGSGGRVGGEWDGGGGHFSGLPTKLEMSAGSIRFVCPSLSPAPPPFAIFATNVRDEAGRIVHCMVFLRKLGY